MAAARRLRGAFQSAPISGAFYPVKTKMGDHVWKCRMSHSYGPPPHKSLYRLKHDLAILPKWSLSVKTRMVGVFVCVCGGGLLALHFANLAHSIYFYLVRK